MTFFPLLSSGWMNTSRDDLESSCIEQGVDLDGLHGPFQLYDSMTPFPGGLMCFGKGI